MNFPRACIRLIRLAWVLGSSALEYVLISKSRSDDPVKIKAAQIAWGSRVAGKLVNIHGLKINVFGACPKKGCLVSNHLGYLDIFVLYSLCPFVFVGKADIARWPFFGWLATHGGILYIKREQRGDVARVIAEIRHLLGAGLQVAFFPEGTSSRGQEVLPFRSPLIESICEGQNPVTAAAIAYQDNARASYAGNDLLLPHLWRMLGTPAMEVNVRFSAPMLFHSSRKHTTQNLHNEVSRLHRSLHPELPLPANEQQTTAISV